jgi:hypothetical protein
VRRRRDRDDERWAEQSDSKMVRWVYLLTHWRAWLALASADAVLRRWRGILTVLVSLSVMLYAGSWKLGLLVFLAIVGFRVWRRKPRTKRGGWWDHATLGQALVDAGILRRDRDQLPTLSYKGKPQHTDHGTTVAVALPQAVTLGDVLARRVKLASAMREPENRLHVSQDSDDPANVVRIHVSTPSTGDTAPPVASADRTDWRDPVEIATTSRGEAIALETFEHNTLIAGRPGSGKTAAGRMPVGHFLLDPTTSVLILDGKGAVDDYGACRHLCDTYIAGSSDTAVAETLAMLRRVLAEVQRRNAAGGRHPGMLVVLEELQEIRAACGGGQLDLLDETLGRIVRQGRAVGVVVLILTQKPSKEDLSTGVRSQVSQRLALMLRTDDFRLVLGDTPTVAVPKRRGLGIWTNGGDHELVHLHRFTDQAWARVCKRATTLRAGGGPGEGSDEPTQRLPVLDGLLADVVEVLAGEPGGLTPAALHAALPEDARPVTARELGVRLARHPGVVERVTRDRARVWRLTSEGRRLVGTGRLSVNRGSETVGDSLGDSAETVPRRSGDSGGDSATVVLFRREADR